MYESSYRLQMVRNKVVHSKVVLSCSNHFFDENQFHILQMRIGPARLETFIAEPHVNRNTFAENNGYD